MRRRAAIKEEKTEEKGPKRAGCKSHRDKAERASFE